MKRIVVITGAGGGIGRATAARFRRDTWTVIGLEARDNQGGEDLDELHFVDVGEPAAVERWRGTLAARGGGIDALVNNAAVTLYKSLVDTTPEEWDQLLRVNLGAAHLMTRALFPLLRNRQSAIVNVSSVHALATSAGVAAYAASKGGLLALTRAMAIELAHFGIRVNAVLPGAVDTPMLRAGLGRGHREDEAQERLDDLARRTVAGRIGAPEDIAEAILFLADHDRSSFMTGQALVVDGGATARLSTE